MVLNLFQLTGTAKIPSLCEWISDLLALQKVKFVNDSYMILTSLKGEKNEENGSKMDISLPEESAGGNIIVFAYHQDVLNALAHLLTSHKKTFMYTLKLSLSIPNFKC